MTALSSEGFVMVSPAGAPADLALLADATAADLRALKTRIPSTVGVWIAEYLRDAFVTAALFADAPLPVFGTAIAQAFPRTPLVTALAAVGLDEMTGGRFVLGLGSQVAKANARWHGLDVDRPVARLTDYVRAVRAAMVALSGGEPAYAGDFYHFDLRGRPPLAAAGQPPIYVAAVQPRMARAAGEVADGLIGHMLHTPEFLAEHIVPAARAGAARVGRELASFGILLYRCCIPIDIHPEAERDARRQVGFYAATKTYFGALAGMGFAAQAEVAQKALARGSMDDLVAAVDDAMLEAFAIVGTVAECAARLGPLGDGVDRVLLFPPYLTVPPQRLMAYHDAVLDVAAAHNATLPVAAA